MSDEKWHVEEKIPSETGAGARIVHQVLDQLKLFEYADRFVFDVHMALEEAIVNAIKHGNQLDPAKQVHIICSISRQLVQFEVEDEGPGFCEEDVPDPTDPENWEKPSGRGLLLMRSYMDSVEFNDSGNRVVMKKHRPPVAEAES